MTRRALILLLPLLTGTALANIMWYGDQDVLGTASYGADPTAAATLIGQDPGSASFGGPEVNHGFPFDPSAGDYPGTDQIYVGSVQTASHDGYSSWANRMSGPMVISLDYSSLVPAGERVETLTLGIAADDFQRPSFGNPYLVSVNHLPSPVLEGVLNGLNQTGPQVQFFTIGIETSLLQVSDVLVLEIDQGGDGGDGWAVDFLSIGVTTVPETVLAEDRPLAFELDQNAPNPFNPSTGIFYRLEASQRVRLSVHSLDGREVALLEEGLRAGGEHRVTFDATGLATGVYFYRLEAADQTLTRKMLLVK